VRGDGVGPKPKKNFLLVQFPVLEKTWDIPWRNKNLYRLCTFLSEAWYHKNHKDICA